LRCQRRKATKGRGDGVPGDQKNLLEVLEELLLDPGWQVFKAHADQEWGPRQYRSRVQAALSATDPEAAVIGVECAATEIERLLHGPRAGEPVAGAVGERTRAADDDDRWPPRLTLVDRPHVYQPPPDDWDDDDEPPTWFGVLLALLVALGFWGLIFYAWHTAW